MRLKHLEISGFRGFSSKQEFDLSADATVVVGSNGLGKTSFLDAIHWGMCGRLGRLGSGDDKVISLYSNDGQARVTLALEGPNDEIIITRVTDGEKQTVRTVINGEELRGSSASVRVLEKLWPDAVMAQNGEEALSLALTRSVYLQQDRVRNFLEGSTDQDRFNVISELVGAGRLTDLQSELETQGRSWNAQTTKLKREQSPLLERVENLKSQLARLQRATDLGDKLDESQWTNWWKKLEYFDIDVEELPSATAVESRSLLDNLIRELQGRRDQLSRRRRVAERAKELLDSKPEVPKQSTEELKKRLDAANLDIQNASSALKSAQEKAAEERRRQVAAEEATEQRRALAQLALKLLDEKCPVCQQEYDVEATRRRLETILASEQQSDAETALPRMKIEELAINERNAVAKGEQLKRLFDDALRMNKTFVSWQEEFEEKLADIGLSRSEESETEISKFLLATTKRIEEIKSHVEAGERLALNIAREAAVSRIKSTETDLKTAQQEVDEFQKAMSKRESTSATIRKLIEELREARSKFAIDKLSEIEPLLQRIFARIDPHPTFRAVKLATDFFRGRGRLDAEIQDSSENKSCRNPEIIFSSSQLNALAVSIFLSFNIALPDLPLQAAMLDDPIQSLDDINLLGLVDLLRRTKEKRQVIVSTHDSRFGKLLARKLRPASSAQTTSVIELRGWKRSGPEVIQFHVRADEMPLRLAAVS